MAKSKIKGGKKDKSSAKTKKVKAAKTLKTKKASAVKVPKAKKIKEFSAPPVAEAAISTEETTSIPQETPAESETAVAAGDGSGESDVEEDGSEESEAIVVEVPDDEVFIAPAPQNISFSPAAEQPVKTEPTGMDIMVQSLNKMYTANGKPQTKVAIEENLKLNPRNLPFYMTPKYEGNTFTIEVSDGKTKVSTRPFPLAV